MGDVLAVRYAVWVIMPNVPTRLEICCVAFKVLVFECQLLIRAVETKGDEWADRGFVPWT